MTYRHIKVDKHIHLIWIWNKNKPISNHIKCQIIGIAEWKIWSHSFNIFFLFLFVDFHLNSICLYVTDLSQSIEKWLVMFWHQDIVFSCSRKDIEGLEYKFNRKKKLFYESMIVNGVGCMCVYCIVLYNTCHMWNSKQTKNAKTILHGEIKDLLEIIFRTDVR